MTAAYLGVAIELGGSVLLAMGLATRLAAVAMLALSWVIQFNYVALDTNLFWAVLFGWYVARGAGSWSLDHTLSRGLADSALPLAKTVIGFSDGVTRYFGPVYQGLLRVWIGAALALAALSHGGAVSAESIQGLSLWLPLKAAGVFPPTVAIACAVLLAVGLAHTFCRALLDPRHPREADGRSGTGGRLVLAGRHWPPGPVRSRGALHRCTDRQGLTPGVPAA